MKCFAEFEWGGKWRRIVSAHRPLLCAHMSRVYGYENVLEQIRGYTRKEINDLVDVGACIGGYSLLYTETFPEATIYAVEPASINWDDLLENIAPYPNIVPAKMAAWDKNEEIQIALTTVGQKDYLHNAQNVGQISVYGDSEVHRETVPARRLDDVIERADYIKVDAEGADMKVVQGAEGIIRKCRPMLQLEMMPPNLKFADLTVEEYLNYIVSLGYGYFACWHNDFIFAPTELLTQKERDTKYTVQVKETLVKVWETLPKKP